jgi:RNA polymerase sigma-70 factor (ECF subfamily)
MGAAHTSETSELLAAYLATADDLKRFLAVRLRSLAAAEDLLQDLYVKVAAWPPDAQIGNPSALLYRMASNLMLDQMRTERRTAARDAAWTDLHTTRVGGEPVSEEASGERIASDRQRAAELARAIDTLPSQTRAAFVMHKLDGFSHAEIAQRLGISRKTVEKQVSAGLRRLTALLKDSR